ncbi:ABC transporter ATP-binding protein [Motiliproteus sp. SC1-56]|uniref:ABC transporter ATP-binding protein n=1 Tax=Motiliproteus sp. SC1-56 TaxID=2799565 RepID=UPI001A8D7D1C|nr:ATP-binding cassette domain-containing protein [Motiliproteus sp. SC1-56]
MQPTTTQPLLEVSDLSMRFGGILALNSASLNVLPGSITAIIGPNGAGKTTLFNCITGFYRATSGAIRFNSGNSSVDLIQVLGGPFKATDLTDPRAFSTRLYYKMLGGSHRVALAGVARTFQNIRLFDEMTAIENLLVAQHTGLDRNVVGGFLRTGSYLKSEHTAVDRAFYWLDKMGLGEDANRLAGELPYGHQRRLEIARAMCTQPKMICLDEPAAGLNPNETKALSEMIQMLRREHDVAVLLIEHDMGMVMDISDHIVVLDHGEVIAAGTPQHVENDPAVLAAYLGADYETGVAL